MTVLATVEVDPTVFVPGGPLPADLSVELERVVPAGDEPLPYLWIDDPIEGVRDTIRRASPVERIEHLDSTDDRTLIRIEWLETPRPVEWLVEARGTLLSGEYVGGRWSLELRFPRRRALQAFHRRCGEGGVDLRVDRIYTPQTDRKTVEGLSVPQRDLLRLAHREGYFDVPRSVTLGDLAEDLNVSDSALSKRLRRGLATLVENELDPAE